MMLDTRLAVPPVSEAVFAGRQVVHLKAILSHKKEKE
jgi:hypothetical protein